MKDVFYTSSYSSTTSENVKETRKQAAKDIKKLRKMNQEEAKRFLLERFNIDVQKLK